MPVDESSVPLSDGTKVPELYDVESGQAKFVKDGEAVDVHATSQLIGLTKEQLEKYRNDPFWKPVRLIMFILFWLAWIAMFAGAILIVVLSPKCSTVAKPEWYRTDLSYQVFTPTFRDSDGDGIGDFNGIREKLDDIRRLGIDTVWATPVISSYKDDFRPFDVIDFEKVDERFGTMSDFKTLLDAIHDNNMRFVMDLPISTVSKNHPWFENAKSGGEFRDYFIWKKPTDGRNVGESIPVGDSGDAVLSHNGNDVVLNWESGKVRDAIVRAAKLFLDAGVDGLHLAYASQLLRSANAFPNAKAALDALESFKKELDAYIDSVPELKSRKVVVFASTDDMKELQPLDLQDERNLAGLEYVIEDSVKHLSKKDCENGLASCLQKVLEKSKTAAAWQFTDYSVSRPTSRFDIPTGNLLTFVQLALPNSIHTYYGQELGLTDTERSNVPGVMQWDDTQFAGFSSVQPFFGTTNDYKNVNYKSESDATRSMLKTFRTIAKLRQRDENFITSDMKVAEVKGDVLTFSRARYENGVAVGPMYLLVANFADTGSEIDVRAMLPKGKSAEKAEVMATTTDVDAYPIRTFIDLSSSMLTLNSKQGILLRI